MQRSFLAYFILLIFIYSTLHNTCSASEGSARGRALMLAGGPVLNDSRLHIQRIFSGLKYPTSMAFLAPNDILISEKDGIVQRIINGHIQKQPLINLIVDKTDERGLDGLTVSSNESRNITNVFLYYTEFKPTYHSLGVTLGNRVYRYELSDNKLINPKLLLDLPINPAPSHVGGKMKIGPDGNLYLTVGDMDGSFNATKYETRAQNYNDGPSPDGRAGILTMTQDGKPVGDGILGSTPTLNLYYAYGIKNSFGFDFDPITNKMWDTENGPTFGDEINLVEPGFNSGWAKVQGVWVLNNITERIDKHSSVESVKLEDFNGRGRYSNPEFTWLMPVAPTAIAFMSSDRLGIKYQNDIFVSDIKFGNIYHFRLNEDRTQLFLDDALEDKIANTMEESQSTIFGYGFGGITDLEVGPDGYLYVLTYDSTNGTVYKITSKN
ncbi:MAG: PQQ-dependent sugar dehydrogenase [Nitrososphaerota archaeon]